MQELEKIMAEIDNLYVDETDFGIECNMENRSNIACDNCYECIKEACKNIIRNHMNDGWIPVEECPPEEPKENPEFEGKKIELYLVTVKGTKYPFRAMWNGKFFTDGWSKCNVIAWRPLPEPYRPERNSEE